MESSILSLSEIIACQIVKQLTSNMDYKQLEVCFQKQRSQKSKQVSVQFNQQMIENLTNLDQIKGNKTQRESEFQEDHFENNNRSILGKRISVVKLNKTTLVENKPYLNVLNKKSVQAFKRNLKGLVKLDIQQEDSPVLSEYVEKMRQRKVKYAEAMSMFVEDDQDKQKLIKNFRKDSQNSFINHTQRKNAFITSFEGEKVRQQKKQLKSKKDSLYTEKIKVKPAFKLRQYVSSRRDVKKTEGLLPEVKTETKRSSILKARDVEGKDENYYIKSIMDVIVSRKEIDSNKRKKLEPLRH